MILIHAIIQESDGTVEMFGRVTRNDSTTKEEIRVADAFAEVMREFGYKRFKNVRTVIRKKKGW